MKASKLLEQYEEYIQEQGRKPGRYAQVARAFLNKQEKGKIILALENAILISSDSQAYVLGHFMEFLTASGKGQTIIDPDFEKVFCKDIQLVEEFCETTNGFHTKSAINQFLKASERGDSLQHVKRLPPNYKEWVYNFIQWIEQTKKVISCVLDMTALSLLAPKKEDSTLSKQSIKNRVEGLSIPDFEKVIIEVVLLHDLSVNELAKMRLQDLLQWCEEHNLTELISRIEKFNWRSRDLVVREGKVKIERIVQKGILQLNIDKIKTITDWRKHVKG